MEGYTEEEVREALTDDFGHTDPTAQDMVEKINALKVYGTVSVECSRLAQHAEDGKQLYPERWQVICGVPRGVAERFGETALEAVKKMYLHLRPDSGY